MRKRIEFVLNEKLISEDVNPSEPLLDFIRKSKHLHGTKEVCKEGDCGACTVLVGAPVNSAVNYKTVTSCIFPIGNVQGCHVVTIEGLNSSGLIPQQKSFVDEGASQCGFCTPGFIVSLTGYLLNSDDPSIEKAVNALGGNICRCTGYKSIERAVEKSLSTIGKNSQDRIGSLIQQKIIPGYFDKIFGLLDGITKRHPGNGRFGKKFVGGGSDLYVQRPEEMINEDLAFTKDLNLNLIEEKDGHIYLGGAVTFEELLTSELISGHFPKLTEQLELVASLPIRNMATIAGNLVNASPIGDISILLLALGAELILYNNEVRRIIRLQNFFLDYKQIDLHNDEFIEFVKFPVPSSDSSLNFEKVSKRQYLDIASVNTALFVEEKNGVISQARLSAGGVAPVPKLIDCADLLIGSQVNLQLMEKFIGSLELYISPISDVRGSAEYKTLLLKQLVKAHFLELFPEKIEAGALA